MEEVINKNHRTVKIIYWISTLIVALFELIGALYMNSEMAIEGMHHLMLPNWFRWEVSIGHLIGGILLIVPVPPRIKEWVYVAFVIDFISACIAYWHIDGFGANAISPLIMLTLLIISYICYHKIKNEIIINRKTSPVTTELIN
ncbi:MAG: DoxX family protein [Chitinophagaceae bacterium]